MDQQAQQIYYKDRQPASAFSEWQIPDVPPLSEGQKNRGRANHAGLFPDEGPEDEAEAPAVRRAGWRSHFKTADPSDQIWAITR